MRVFTKTEAMRELKVNNHRLDDLLKLAGISVQTFAHDGRLRIITEDELNKLKALDLERKIMRGLVTGSISQQVVEPVRKNHPQAPEKVTGYDYIDGEYVYTSAYALAHGVPRSIVREHVGRHIHETLVPMDTDPKKNRHLLNHDQRKEAIDHWWKNRGDSLRHECEGHPECYCHVRASQG